MSAAAGFGGGFDSLTRCYDIARGTYAFGPIQLAVLEGLARAARRSGRASWCAVKRFSAGRRCVLVWAIGAVVLVGPMVLVGGEQAAVASGRCSDVIPVDALAGSVFGHGGGGAFVLGASTAVEAATAGGAVAAAGTVGLAAAVFLGSVYGTCKFIDWVSGDAAGDAAPFYGPGSVTYGSEFPCSAVYSLTYVAATDKCLTVTFPTTVAAYRAGANQHSTYSTGGVSIPGVNQYASMPQLYGSPGPSGGSYYLTEPVSGQPLTVLKRSYTNIAGTYWCGFMDSEFSHCQYGGGANPSMVLRYKCTYNIGGMCGLPPSTVYYGIADLTGTSAFSYIVPVFPGRQAVGWDRQVVTDVLCWTGGSGGSGGWVRAVSDTYSDRVLNQRIETPDCPAGSRAVKVKSWRVPTGLPLVSGQVACALGADPCWQANAAIFKWDAPATFTTGTAPDWQECLSVGTPCGDPAVSSGGTVCLWGSHSVPLSYCDATKQAGVGTDPVTMPKASGSVTPEAYTTGTILETNPGAAPDPPPDTDPPSTGGAAIDTQGETEARTAYEGEDVCWPSGWGWFNPALWVLRPIKCAAEWAVVPDSAELAVRMETFNALRTEPPLQWVDAGVAFITDSSFLFGRWSEYGPACSDVMGATICPRSWDVPAAVPSWLVGAVLFGVWSMLVFAIWRWF